MTFWVDGWDVGSVFTAVVVDAVLVDDWVVIGGDTVVVVVGAGSTPSFGKNVTVTYWFKIYFLGTI